MVARDNSPTVSGNYIGAKGSAVAPINTREISNPSASLPLAKYSAFVRWQPKIGDFIIWHGLWGRWYGLVNAIDGDELHVVKENLPVLLFTLSMSEYAKNTIQIPIGKIVRSRGGEYHILQGDTWYIE